MPKQPYGSPRQKLRQQLEQQGKSPKEIQEFLEQTFGPEPKNQEAISPRAFWKRKRKKKDMPAEAEE